MKYATFFGGAINDRTTKEYNDSILIGNFLANNDYVVKNGGYRGLMEAVSKGATEAGGEAHGYVCRTFGHTKGNEFLTETIICNDIYDRLGYLIPHSELFVIQRGGIGTLAELFLLLDEVRKTQHKPKIYLFGEQWNNLFKYMGDFMSQEQIDMITFCEDFEDFKEKFN